MDKKGCSGHVENLKLKWQCCQYLDLNPACAVAPLKNISWQVTNDVESEPTLLKPAECGVDQLTCGVT